MVAEGAVARSGQDAPSENSVALAQNSTGAPLHSGSVLSKTLRRGVERRRLEEGQVIGGTATLLATAHVPSSPTWPPGCEHPGGPVCFSRAPRRERVWQAATSTTGLLLALGQGPIIRAREWWRLVRE